MFVQNRGKNQLFQLFVHWHSAELGESFFALITKVLSNLNPFNPLSGPVKLMFKSACEGFMREFKLNSNNKHVATD